MERNDSQAKMIEAGDRVSAHDYAKWDKICAELQTKLTTAERECDDHKKIKEAEKLILIEEVAKNAKLETALRTAEAELANLSNPNWCYNNLAAHHTFTRDKMVSAERRIGEPLMEDIRLLNEDIENKKAALHAAESSLKVAGSELALYEWLINDGGRVVKMNDGSGYDYYGRGRALESVKGAPTPIACIKAARLAEK